MGCSHLPLHVVLRLMRLGNNVLWWVGGSQPSQVSDSDKKSCCAVCPASSFSSTKQGLCAQAIRLWVCKSSLMGVCMQPSGFFSSAWMNSNVWTNPGLGSAPPACSVLCPLWDGAPWKPRHLGSSNIHAVNNHPASFSLYWILVG